MSAARVRVGRIVLRREISMSVVSAVFGAAAAAYAAYAAAAARDAPPSLFGRALGRFDLTLLYLAAAMAILRIAGRIEQDTDARWLDGFVAAGASRVRYAFSVAAGALAAAAALFGAGALVFSAAAFAATGSSELLIRLPRTLSGGLLLLLHWCAWVALVATLLRRALAAFFTGFLLAIAPLVLLTLQLQRSGSADVWLVWLVRALPPLVPADDPPLGLIQVAASVLLAIVTARAAESFIARHP
jgi:hypothetical protein